MHEDPIKKSFQAQCSVTLSLRKNRFQCAKYKTINYTILKVEFMSENSISTLRAKRATFTFKVDKSSMKMPKKIGQFWRVFENLNFAFKKCYQTGQFLVIEKLKCDIDSQTLWYGKCLFFCTTYVRSPRCSRLVSLWVIICLRIGSLR